MHLMAGVSGWSDGHDSLRTIGQLFKAAAKILVGQQVLAHALAFLGAVHQPAQGDG